MRRSFLLACAMLAGCVGPASALTSCSVSSTALSFGVYSTSSSSPMDATATVGVSCTVTLGLLASWTVSLGTGISGVQTARQMVSGSNTLAYQIYTDAGRTVPWGDGGGITDITDINLGSFFALLFGLINTNYTAYGRIPARQSVPGGIYTDAIIVTIGF